MRSSPTLLIIAFGIAIAMSGANAVAAGVVGIAPSAMASLADACVTGMGCPVILGALAWVAAIRRPRLRRWLSTPIDHAAVGVMLLVIALITLTAPILVLITVLVSPAPIAVVAKIGGLLLSGSALAVAMLVAMLGMITWIGFVMIRLALNAGIRRHVLICFMEWPWADRLTSGLVDAVMSDRMASRSDLLTVITRLDQRHQRHAQQLSRLLASDDTDVATAAFAALGRMQRQHQLRLVLV
jgi:hypothetical protein